MSRKLVKPKQTKTNKWSMLLSRSLRMLRFRAARKARLRRFPALAQATQDLACACAVLCFFKTLSWAPCLMILFWFYAKLSICDLQKPVGTKMGSKIDPEARTSLQNALGALVVG